MPYHNWEFCPECGKKLVESHDETDCAQRKEGTPRTKQPVAVDSERSPEGAGEGIINPGSAGGMQCLACHRHYYHNPPPVVAVVGVDGEGRLLAVKRAVEPAKGKWALAGGFMDLMETPEDAALRELAEESGLAGEVKRLLGVLYQQSDNYGSVIVIGYEIAVAGKPRPGSDALEARFFAPSDMPSLAFSSHRELMETYISRENT